LQEKQKEADWRRLFVYSPNLRLDLRQPAVHGHFEPVMNEASADARNATARRSPTAGRFASSALGHHVPDELVDLFFGKPVRAKPSGVSIGPGSLHLRESLARPIPPPANA